VPARGFVPARTKPGPVRALARAPPARVRAAVPTPAGRVHQQVLNAPRPFPLDRAAVQPLTLRMEVWEWGTAGGHRLVGSTPLSVAEVAAEFAHNVGPPSVDVFRRARCPLRPRRSRRPLLARPARAV